MKNEENKALEAVKIIQQYCDKKKHCSDCIFGEEKHITDCISEEEKHITVQIQCGLSNRFPYDWDSLKEVKNDR